MKIHIPCPINEKDLCSDVLFDDLFDDNAYCCDGHGVLIGFVHRHVVKMTYIKSLHPRRHTQTIKINLNYA